MTDRLLIIGEAPSNDGAPLEGQVGATIAEYAGISIEEYLARTERHNLFPQPILIWHDGQARQNAIDIWPSLIGRTTLLLGRNVTLAFGLHPPDLSLTWKHPNEDVEIAMLPHPSGRNRWWNDPENRSAARRFLHQTFGIQL
jgi:hypothetical protein